jgi:hypothetical protein
MKRISLLIAMGAALLLTGCSDWKTAATPETPEPSKTLEIAQIEVMKARAEEQAELHKRVTTLQLDVIKRCADRGNTPVLFNGNVDCKAGLPAAR